MASYPVVFDIQQQPTYNRVHVAIRVVIIIVLGSFGYFTPFGQFFGAPFGLLYLAVPVIAAILISQKGGRRYLDESEQNMAMWLRWIAALFAYFMLLTDRLPNEDPQETLRFDVKPDAEPTAGGVLVRIILAIPHAIVLALIGIVAFILWVIALIMILVQEKYPESIFGFLRADLRWNARVYAYLAGLAQAYPPFAFDTGSEGGEPGAAGVAPMTPPPGTDAGATP
jgi:uncharacterized protein DUF4389